MVRYVRVGLDRRYLLAAGRWYLACQVTRMDGSGRRPYALTPGDPLFALQPLGKCAASLPGGSRFPTFMDSRFRSAWSGLYSTQPDLSTRNVKNVSPSPRQAGCLTLSALDRVIRLRSEFSTHQRQCADTRAIYSLAGLCCFRRVAQPGYRPGIIVPYSPPSAWDKYPCTSAPSPG